MLTKATEPRHLFQIIYALYLNYYQRALNLISDYLMMSIITISKITVITAWQIFKNQTVSTDNGL